MSLLAIDVGNTEITLGLKSADGWRARWRLRTSDRRTADEYREFVRGLFRIDGVELEVVRFVAISCVVPSITETMTAVSVSLFEVEPLVVVPGVRTGLEVRYEPASHLGSDRILDAVAARARLGAPVIVVDFGTATTITVVAGDGALVGGAIAPGVGVAAEALARFGARLTRIDLAARRALPVVGSNTEASMRSGVLHGHAALVEGLLARMQSELMEAGDGRAPVVATGGMSRVIAPLTDAIDLSDPDLTLDGLCLIHALNRS